MELTPVAYKGDPVLEGLSELDGLFAGTLDSRGQVFQRLVRK